MKNRIREDGVEFVLVRQRADIPSLELKQREVFAGLGDHGFGTIHAEYFSAGLSDPGGEMAGAAAGVQDAFAGLGGEQRQQVAAKFPNEGVRSIESPAFQSGGICPL